MPQRTRVSVYIATSLDGFIARADGDVSWLHSGTPPDEGEDYGYEAFVSTVDTIVMGRKSFEKVLTFEAWPYEKPVIVMSSTVTNAPEDFTGNVTFSDASLWALMKSLSFDGVERVYIDGGKLVQSFLSAGLVDDLTLTTLPILLGQGLPLFGALKSDIRLKLIESKSWNNGFVQSRYEVIKPEGDSLLEG